MTKRRVSTKARNTSRSMIYRVRDDSHPRKGLGFTMKRRSASPKPVVQTIMNVSQTKKDRRKAREFRDIVKVINEPELVENLGLYIDKHGNLVSTEAETVNDIQYELLIKELEHRLEFANDNYEAKIVRKAIKFVTKAREANKRNADTNSLTKMMAAL